MPVVDISSVPQKTINVLAGKTLELDLPIVGRPPPVCSWYFGDNKLKVTDRVKIKSTGKFSKLTVSDTTIDDTGAYTLEVKNAVGVTTVVIKVTILGMYHNSPIFFMMIQKAIFFLLTEMLFILFHQPNQMNQRVQSDLMRLTLPLLPAAGILHSGMVVPLSVAMRWSNVMLTGPAGSQCATLSVVPLTSLRT